MKKLLFSLLLTFSLFFSRAPFTLAIEDPFAVPNNKYGIHVIEESDLTSAADLVNSNGGEWGYVTIVIPQNDRNNEKWQRVFTKCSELHLIPLVRIASNPVGAKWEVLQESEIENWVNFLSSLSWPTKNRYVIVGNEPNHAKEWGGKVNPGEYANFLKNFSVKAKESSPDYFILPAGLDASAPNLLGYMSEDKYLNQMVLAVPDIFDHIDGWTSHSYPNPAFSGKETDSGRGTIKTYEWEMEYLKSLGVTKNLPIFITETGWIHSMNGKLPILTDTKSLTEKYKYAFTEVWTSPSIVTITPFLLNYQSFPFETFSWKDPNGNFYNFYYEVKSLPKTGGNPKRIEKPKPIQKKRTPPAMEFASVFLFNDIRFTSKDKMLFF